MKKKALLAGLASSVLLLGACGSQEAEEAAATTTTDGKTEVVFWHAMSGDLETALNNQVDAFNESQEEYEVKPVFQGTYEEALTKFNAVAGSPDAPAIMQTFEVGTKYMIDSNKITPVQEFIDKEDFDTSVWEENILSYYQVDGKQYSMPFNSSTPVLIYNKDAFEKAGLDPEKAPRTYDELKQAAKALTTDGQTGFTMLNYGWFFEQLVAAQGGLYVDNDNGRSGAPTKAVFDGEEGQNAFNLIKEMYDEKTFLNVGQNWDDMRAAFQSGKVAMYLDSSAGIRTVADNTDFEVGASYLPVPNEADREGVIIGGASLWMGDGIADETKQGAWEFMKYAASKEAQAKWHVETGYFAINPDAYDEPVVKEMWAEYPQLKVTVDQLSETKASPATQGALISTFPQSRQSVVNAMESLYQGVSVEEALKSAADETTSTLGQ
ncbi:MULTISPECIES: ABC transporter substrate-binding protein [Exiguobacterium]|uniref:ABC transporter substrate-binding protein n=1 Tax=Exiguobacterium TaxID=33986 RepID=UPI001BEAECEA|nr:MULTISPECIES: ABC transporter substrate-binding protein [Exiguobacterium]MCT4776062.1 ABC transporter substrate-binding protein [Exiguobacterium aquaticum]MCT4788028.1 ABC transporter substrate-binding protein [Exiguobacterium mexicanum]